MADEIVVSSETAVIDRVLIVPVTMIRPNSECIYAPSHLAHPFYTNKSNLRAIVNCSRTILVSLEKDGISNPQPMMAYGLGWYCWFVAIEEQTALPRAG